MIEIYRKLLEGRDVTAAWPGNTRSRSPRTSWAVDEVNILDAMDMPLEHKRKFFQSNAESVFELA